MSGPILTQGEVIPHCGRGTPSRLHLPTRLSVRGAHGPLTLGLIRDWVAGHATLIPGQSPQALFRNWVALANVTAQVSHNG